MDIQLDGVIDNAVWAQLGQQALEAMLTNVSETFGHADVARAAQVAPVAQEGNQTVMAVRGDMLSDTAVLPYMKTAGHSIAQELLGGASARLIHFPHAPDPKKNPNEGRYLTLLGQAWNAGRQPGPDLYQASPGPSQTAYHWVNSGGSPYRWISQKQVEENPAAWWTKPTFDYAPIPAGQWGLFAQIRHLYGGDA